MRGYVLSPAAEHDLDDIWDYTVGRWGEAQAERYILNIESTVQCLVDGTQPGLSAEDISRPLKYPSLMRSDALRRMLGSHF